MNLLNRQRDSRRYRFALPNEVWSLCLKPPAFAILAYLSYLHQRNLAVPTAEIIAAQLHMSSDTAAEHIVALISRGLVTPALMPVFNHNGEEKFFTLPNKLFSLDLGHGPIAVYSYLLFCEDRRTHQCYPSYSTIAAAVGLAVYRVMKHIAKPADRQLITVERTSYLDGQGMKWNDNNRYTILPIQRAVDCFHQRQMDQLNLAAERQRIKNLLPAEKSPV